MFKYFAKLNGNFEFNSDIEKIRDVTTFGATDTHQKFKGINYSRVKLLEMEDVYKVIPKGKKKFFFLNLMRINSKVPTHTDSTIKTCINFYIKTENCVTYFHEPKVENPRKFQISNQTDGYIFHPLDLQIVKEFNAKPTEAWVLNVKEPHSVVPLSGIEERVALSLQTKDFTFDEVCEMLKETGYL